MSARRRYTEKGMPMIGACGGVASLGEHGKNGLQGDRGNQVKPLGVTRQIVRYDGRGRVISRP